MTTSEEMVERYVPVPIYYEEGDYLEYVERDVPTVVEQVSHGFAVIKDMTTRQVIGFRLCDWAHYAATLSP